jgi:hypothetical protein
MEVPSLKDCVGADKKVRFVKCVDGELTYACENGFEFTIPPEDLVGATFLAEDKSMFFMRWIRRRIEFVKTWKPLSPFEDEGKESA